MISSAKKLLCKVMKNSLETKCDAIHLAGPSAAGADSWLVFFCEFCSIFSGIAVTGLWRIVIIYKRKSNCQQVPKFITTPGDKIKVKILMRK